MKDYGVIIKMTSAIHPRFSHVMDKHLLVSFTLRDDRESNRSGVL